MSINGNCDKKFVDVQPAYSRNSESWIRNLVWVYTVIAVVALAQFVFLAVKYSGQFSEFCDYIFNPDPNKPLSLILLVSGGWFIVLLSLAAVILVIAISIAYWIIGIVSAVLVLSSLFKSHIYAVSSLFIGFIVFSIPLIIKEEKDSLKGKYYNIIWTIIGIAIVALITYFNPMKANASSVDIIHFNFGMAIYMFFAAMVAISAMVLPGISGSTLMLIFGLYIPVITAAKELMHFNFAGAPALIIMGLGVIAGIILVIRGIKLALKKYRSATMYMILGLMIGSLYAIVMGPTTLEVPLDPMTFKTFKIITFILGGILVVGLEFLKRYLERKQK